MSEKTDSSKKNTIEIITPEADSELGENDYRYDLIEHFSNIPVVARPLVDNAKLSFRRIEEMLYSAPAFVELVKASIPEQAFQAILTGEQKRKIATGALELMTKKDGSLLANLINPKTKKVVSTIALEKVSNIPNLSDAMTNYAMQMQMAQIAEQIQDIQLAIEEIRQGQENDRLATAYSCQQKLLQAMKIRNSELRQMALLRITSDAEDSRNLLMLSQRVNVDLIKNEPEQFWKKVFTGTNPKKINTRISEIRDSLLAINLVSLAEAIAYQELGEYDAARESLEYYALHIQNTFFDTQGFVERLDSVDPSPENYWSKSLPEIKEEILSLPCSSGCKYLGEKKDGTKGM